MPGEAEVPFSLTPGEILAGRYEIEEGLGTGAMGEVYAARDVELHEAIAIKLLRPEIARNERVLERFKREIQLARRVTHPNVCRVFDLVIAEGPPRRVFLTMERLAGPTLAERLESMRRPFELGEAKDILAKVAAGLDAAHAAGIVHRDLKTGNVILAPARPEDGPAGRARVVLTDFGVAWSESHGGGPEADHLTASGQVVGSPAYMAPEQLRGQAVSPRTDVYAFGVLAYELITRRLPFEGETAFLTALKRIEEDPVPPERWLPELPKSWSAALLKALARRPEDRFASAAEMMAQLDPAVPAPAPVAPVSSRWRPRPRYWLIGAALASTLVFAMLLVERRQPSWVSYGWLPQPWPRGEAGLHFRSGLVALGHDDLAAARTFFESALDKAPDHPAAAFALGEAWDRLGHSQKAREALALACSGAAGWGAEDQERCAARQAELADDWPLAIELYRKLAAGRPDDFELALRLAAARLRVGEIDQLEAQLVEWRARGGGELQALRLDLLEAEMAGGKSDFQRQRDLGERAEREAARLGLRGLRGRALFEAGSGRLGEGDYAGARVRLEEAARLAAELGDLRRRATAARKLGVVEIRLDHQEEALRRYREAEVSYREIGDTMGETLVSNDLGNLHGDARRFAEAEAAYAKGLALARQIGFRRGEAIFLLNMGSLPFKTGDLAKARLLFEQALPALLAVGDRQSAETVEFNLAEIAWRRGELASSSAAMEGLAERHRAEKRANYLTSQILHSLAEVEAARGRGAEAKNRGAQALALRNRLEELQPAFDTRRLLAELAPDPVAALEALEASVADLGELKPEIGLRFYTALTRALLDAGDLPRARQAFERGRAAVAAGPTALWESGPLTLLGMRLGQADAANARELIAAAGRRGLPELELLGRLELAAAAGDRKKLENVVSEARSRGFLALAARAAAQARRL